MKLELYYSEYCPYCQVVLAEVKFSNLSEHIALISTQKDQAAAKRHFEITGRRTVPCLYIDDKPLFESRDIINWLKDNKDKIEAP